MHDFLLLCSMLDVLLVASLCLQGAAIKNTPKWKPQFFTNVWIFLHQILFD